MRRHLAAIVIAVLVAGCAGNPPKETPIRPWSPTPRPTPSAKVTFAPVDTTSWTAFAPAGEGFTIKMPGKPGEPVKSTAETPGGKADLTTWSYAASDYNTAVVVARGNFSGDPKPILEMAIQAVASMNKASVSNGSDVTVGGHPGRVFTLTGTNMYVRMEMLVVGTDIYAAYLGAASPDPDRGISDALFASFQITK